MVHHGSAWLTMVYHGLSKINFFDIFDHQSTFSTVLTQNQIFDIEHLKFYEIMEKKKDLQKRCFN